MKEKIRFGLGLLLASVACLTFNAATARASCEGCELDDNEKDAAYFACVKFHTTNKTASDYEIERTICREPAARKASAAIAACIGDIKKAGYGYGNVTNVCSKNLGFGADLKKYVACYKAETGDKKVDPNDLDNTTDALDNCSYKEFRDNRAAVHTCLEQGDTLWPTPAGEKSAVARSRNSVRQKLVPICTDPTGKTALAEIQSCTQKLLASAAFEWKQSELWSRDTSADQYIENCGDARTRQQLDNIQACRKTAANTVIAQYKESKFLDKLMAGAKPDRYDRESTSAVYEVFQTLDKCITDPTFRSDTSAILDCAVENVKAFERHPFSSMRYIDGSKSTYATLEAATKCMTADDRMFQHRALACMTTVGKRLPPGDLEELKTNDRDPKERVYLWCEMTMAREMGDDTLKGLSATHCPN